MTPNAPRYLSNAAKTWWRAVVGTYELEPHHMRLLTEAAVAWDRIQQARELIQAEGLTINGRFGPRAHPAVAIERDSRIAFARLMRELDLEGAPLPDPRMPRRR